jgi:hypothetical protein
MEGHGFRGYGKTHERVHRRGSCLECVRASAPVIAFPRPMEFFRSLFSRVAMAAIEGFSP